MSGLQETPTLIEKPRRRRPVLTFLRKVYRRWRERHQNHFNFAVHLVGIPLAVAGVVLLFCLPWYWGVGLLVLGYACQYAGHLVEGNDVGEWAAIKRLLGLPYIAIAPRPAAAAPSAGKDTTTL